MAPTPLRITFDTNTYGKVAYPYLIRAITAGWIPLTKDRRKSKLERAASWYLKWCVRRGRIRAAISEGVLSAEALPNAYRLTLLLAVGTPNAVNPPPIDPIRLKLITHQSVI